MLNSCSLTDLNYFLIINNNMMLLNGYSAITYLTISKIDIKKHEQ